ncbi:MAG: single-stranded DNA-binding protein, partial [Spirochaetales bacterium]|nr:single-stranded DNA-binding protein [Spirochaetales bacterium]
WEQDGQKRSKIKIVANNVQLLGSRGGGGGGNSGGGQNRFQKNPDTQADTAGTGESYPEQGSGNFEDDIPF